MLRFYAQLVQRGDVTFDIGANVGVYTEVLANLGASVVAVEPNVECCREIQELTRGAGVIVENCAAGATAGTAWLHVCEESTMSTLSEDWQQAVSRSELHRETKWLKQVQVPIKTLDMLAYQYGQPNFVKIDTEGYDDRVLGGMSFKPAAVSFEFNRNGIDVALKCLERLTNSYLFNYTVAQNFRYELDKWLSGEDMTPVLEKFDGPEEYGEVIARLKSDCGDCART
jgi:FkbM family methyltransferase